MGSHRVVPHFDGAGVIEELGEGVNAKRRGERVWIYGAQWQRDFGTAADYVALHKQKSQRSWKGGRIVGIREATDEELQSPIAEKSTRKGRFIVQFEPIREYNGRPGIRWGGSRKGTMAYKSLETVKDGELRT